LDNEAGWWLRCAGAKSEDLATERLSAVDRTGADYCRVNRAARQDYRRVGRQVARAHRQVATADRRVSRAVRQVARADRQVANR
jgi:hypothetical protein